MLKIYYNGNECIFNEIIKENPLDADIGTASIKTSKVKTLCAVDIEVIHSINELVATLATDNRFNQGLTVLEERGIDSTDKKNTREFIFWVRDDVIKEDRDQIIASHLDFGKVMGNIATMAGKWFSGRCKQ